MRRRTLLATLGTLSAGCLGSPAPSGSGTATPRLSATPASTVQITDLQVATSTDQPSARYVLESTAYYSDAAVEREREESSEPVVVMAVDDIDDPAVRDAVTTALRGDAWRGDDPPAGLLDLVDRVDFFTGVPADDTYTHIGLTLYRLYPDRPPAIGFDASVTDADVTPDSPGTITLALTNTGERPRYVSSGTVPPFGLVFAEGEAGKFLLWRPYTEEGCVSFGDHGLGACDIGKVTTLAPGEELTRAYDVLPPTTDTHPDYTAPPGPGTYRFSDDLGYSLGDGAPGSTLSFEVDFTLEASK